MNLTKLVDALASLDPAMPITLDGASGLGVHSWRGWYREPSIALDASGSRFAKTWRTNTDHGFAFEEPTSDLRFPAAETVGDLLTVLRAVVNGAGLNGWKGGVYTAVGTSNVYADEEGCCPGRIVSGVMVAGGVASLTVETADDDDAR